MRLLYLLPVGDRKVGNLENKWGQEAGG